MNNDFTTLKSNFGMGFTIQSLLRENSDLLKTNSADTDKEKDGDPWGSMDAQAAFLGPNIWGSAPSVDFKLEDLDLDNFLDNPLLGSAASPSPQNSLLSGAASPPGDAASPLPLDTLVATPETLLSEDAADSPLLSLAAAEAAEKPSRKERRRRVAVKFQVSPQDLALASVPGRGRFDPQQRAFSDEELKPQAMCKKSRKQTVPDDSKDDRYWTRRERNNVAAKRSRDARRLKENQIVLRTGFLEKENAALRESLEEIQRENDRLKARLSACSCT